MLSIRGGRFGSLLTASVAVLSAGMCNAVAAYGRTAKPTTTMFGAFTAQKWPVLFEVRTDRSLIRRMQIVMDEKCASGHRNDGIGAVDKGISISRTGSFSDSYTNGPIALPEGWTVTFSDQIRGKFNKARTRITGTWHESATVALSGSIRDTCDSGTVSFTAAD
jgi:hypothetical protein